MVRFSGSIAELLTNIIDPTTRIQTYKNIAYLVLAFPLGMVYAMILGFSFIFGIGLSIVLIGIPILAFVFVAIRTMASFERWLSIRLL